MPDAVNISKARHPVHRDNIFRMAVRDGTQIPELTINRFLIGKEICDLNIYRPVSLLCHEVNLNLPQLPDKNSEPQLPQMAIDSILHHFLYIKLAVPADYPVSYAQILKIVFLSQFL